MGRRVTSVSLEANVTGYIRGMRTAGTETDATNRKVSSLERELMRLGQMSAKPNIALVDADAKARLDAITQRLADLGRKTTDARVTVNDADAQSKLSRVEASLLALGQKTADPNIDLAGIATAEAQLYGLEAQLTKFDHSDYTAEVHIDGTARASRSASLLVDSIAMLGPAAVTAGAAASGAVIGLGAAMSTALIPAGLLGATVLGQVAAMKKAEKQIETDQTKLAGLTKGTADYQAQLHQVNQEQRAFNQQFGVAADALDRFKRIQSSFLVTTGQGGVNQLIADAVRLAGQFLPQIEGIVIAAAGATSKLLADLSAFGRSPDAKELVAFLETRGPAAIEAFGAIAGSLGKGLLSLFMAFAPLENSMLGGLQKITAQFAEWAAHVGDTQGFQAFMEYVQTNGPRVWDTLGSLAQALVAILQAAAPIGAITLPIIRDLADILTLIAHSPVGPILVGAALGLSALNRALTVTAALKASNVGQQIAGMGGNFSKAGAQALAAKAGFVAAGVGLEVLASHLGPAHSELKGFLTIAGGAAMGAAFGPWGAVLGGAAGALQVFSQHAQDAAAQEQVFQQNAQSLADTLNQQTGAITRNTVATAQKNLADTGAYTAGQQLGLSYDTITQAALGNESAIKQVMSAYEGQIQSAQRAGEANRNLHTGYADVSQSIQDVIEKYRPLIRAVGDNTSELGKERLAIDQRRRAIDSANLAEHPFQVSVAQTSKVMNQLGLNIGGTVGHMAAAGQASKPLESHWQQQVDILADATTNLDAYKTALDGLINTSGNVYDSQRAITTGYLNIAAAVKASGTSLSDQTSAGNANIDMLKGQVDNIKSFLENEKEAGKGPAFLAAALKHQRAELVANLTQMGFNKQRVEDLLHTYGLTPKLVTTLMQASTHQATIDMQKFHAYTASVVADPYVARVKADTAQATRDMMQFTDAARRALHEIPDESVNFTLSAQANKVVQQMGGLPGATGGPGHGGAVTGGTPHRDSVHRVLMPNEHIWTEQETAAVGGHGRMKELRQAALQGMFRATGGAAGTDGPSLNLHAAAYGMSTAIRTMEGVLAGVANRIGDRISAALERKLSQYRFMGGGRGAPVGGGLFRPVNGPLTQGLHDQWTGYPAVDVGVPVGTPVHAGATGRVTTSRDIYGSGVGGYASYGRYVVIDSGNFSTLYAHLSQRGVAAGNVAIGGATIGLSGDTGNTTGPHLHFGAAGISPYAFGYARGGMVPPGGIAVNELHQPERMLTPEQNRNFERVAMTGGVDAALVAAVNRVAARVAHLEARFDKPIQADVVNAGQIATGVRRVARNEIDQDSAHRQTLAGIR